MSSRRTGNSDSQLGQNESIGVTVHKTESWGQKGKETGSWRPYEKKKKKHRQNHSGKGRRQ